MANNNSRINFQIGYTVDKSGLQQMQSLFQQIANQAKEPGAKITEGLRQAGQTAETLDKILEKTFNTNLGTLNVTKFNQELAKSKLTLKDVQSSLAQAGNQGATAYNRLAQAVLGTNQQLKQSSKLLNEMATTMYNTARWSVTSSIMNNITAAIQNAYIYSKQLNTSLNDIRIVTDQSAESMERFAVQANTAAKNLGASTLDYTNAALIYYQQGLGAEEAAARAETTVKAANVTGQTGEEVSELLTAVWNGYKVTAEETELYVDKLAAVAASTAADLEELSKGMSKVASAANAMGVDFDDLNAQIATIVSVTRQAPESVGTALKTIYARLGDLKVDGVDEFGVKLGEVSAQLQTMGINILDQEGNMRDMTSVMTEVAEKWNTWTDAQRQAAAVAMAGKRQYNNLIALFENWDMYSDALETSADAMGTLQHQQDIYMESTAAKLKTLKATWQDLYAGLIDDDEIGAGIDALTNLVQVFDNFVDSFGGGIKSIGAFGAVVANIFNKQISEGINGAIQRQEVFKQNLELAQANAQVRMNGAAEVDSTASAYEQGVQANTKAQLEYAQKIYDARIGLNQEQYNTLTNLQQEIGGYEEIIQKNTVLMDKKVQATHLTQEEVKGLKDQSIVIDDIREKQDIITDKIQNLRSAMRNFDEESTSVATIFRELFQESGGLSKGIQQAVQQEDRFKGLLEIINAENATFVASEESIAELIRFINEEQNKENRAVQQYVELLQEGLNAQEQKNNIKQQADEMLRLGNNATIVAQKVTTVTSSLSTMAMAWSSVNSLIQTWNDEEASFGDKITQSFMTLGMTIPMVISSFTKLNEVMNFTVATEKAINLQTELRRSSTLLSIATDIADGKAVSDLAKARLAEAVANRFGVKVNAENVSEKIVEIGEEKVLNSLLKEEIGLRTALNKEKIISTLTNPYFLLIAAATAAVVAIAAVVKIQEEAIKKSIELNNKEIEHINTIQDEIDANKEFYDSYNNLYQQYKAGKIEKQDLYDVTDQLCEKYHLEEGYLAKLTGNYDDLTEAIEKARKAEIKQGQELAQKEIGKATDNILGSGRLTKQGALYGDTYEVTLGSGVLYGDDKQLANFMQQEISGSKIRQGAIVSDVNGNDPKAIVKQYEEIQAAVDKAQKMFDSTVLSNSEIYQNATKYLDEMSETVDKYKTALDDLERYNAESIFADNKIEDVQSYQEYFTTIEKIRKELLTLYNGDSQKVEESIEVYLESIDNEFVKIGHGLEVLKSQLKMSDTEFEKLKDWSDEDKALLFSGKIDFDGIKTADELRKALDIAKSELSKEDLTIVASLRAKVVSDKKLTKKQIEEAAGEESTLSQDYETELYDFDNQSQLDQIDILNDIVNQKIEANQKYITNAKETAKAEAELTQAKIDNYEKEKEYLEEKQKTPEGLTDEELNRLNDLKENIIPNITDELINLQEIMEKGLGFDEIHDLNFDNIITGIEGVINKADVLKDLAEDIGENWQIAADDIEEVALNFPDLLAAQENYNVLQDGSIQLTEQGRVALQGMVEARKAELIAENEAYQLELQKQADIAKATADYYTNQAENLRNYLNGKSTGAEVEANLEKGLTDYKSKLTEITGQDDEELNRVMQQNLGNTVEAAKKDTNSIYEFWCSVGRAAEAASIAYENKSFNPPGAPSGGSAGVNVTSYNRRNSGTEEYISQLEDAQIEAMIQNAEEQAARAQNDYAKYMSEKMAAGASTQAAINAMGNAASGKGGKTSKSKSGGSGSDKEREAERDRYHDLNQAIQQTESSLDKLDKKKEQYTRHNLIRVLKQENKLLEQQSQNYKKLIKAQKHEAGEVKYELGKDFGIKFDKNNNMSNYMEVYENERQKYLAGGDEKRWKRIQDLTKKYDELLEKIDEEQQKRDELRLKKLANNLEKFELKFNIRIDKRDFNRDIRKFKKELNENFQSTYQDYTADITFDQKQFNSYVKDLKDINSEIDNTREEIEKFRRGGTSEMFPTADEAQEHLKELEKQLEETTLNAKDMFKDAWESYLNYIDQAADKLDELQDRFDKVSDELEFQGQLIELIYGEEAYDLMNNLYEGQNKASLNRIQALKAESDMWYKELQKSGALNKDMFEWNEDEKKYYQQWQDAQKALKDEVINDIEIIKKQYENSINSIFKTLEKGLTGNKLSDVESEWERISAQADKYYDSVEGAYQIQTLANKMDQDIAATTSLKVQQRLQKVRDQELAALREKDKLTEYDIKRAELRYQLELKQMALEDARNNKTGMKLTRNDQGNWSYQYVADETDVASKRQELLDTWNELYQLSSDAYEANLKSMQELTNAYLEKSKELADQLYNNLITEEEYTEKMRQLNEEYYTDYDRLAEENAQYREDLEIHAAGLLLEIYNQDKTAYESMTTEEKALIDGLKAHHLQTYQGIEDAIKQNLDNIRTYSDENMEKVRDDWTSKAQEMIDKWNKDDGKSVKDQVNEAYKSIIDVNEDYQDDLDNLSKQAGIDFGEQGVKGAIDEAAGSTEGLRDKTIDLVNQTSPALDNMRSIIESIGTAWGTVADQTETALGQIQKALKEVKSQADKTKNAIDDVANAGTGNGNGSGGSGGGSGTGNPDRTEIPTDDSPKVVTGLGGDKSNKTLRSDGYSKQSEPNGVKNTAGLQKPKSLGGGYVFITSSSQFLDKANKYAREQGYKSFASGGYTGAWGDSGKIAVLHEKELVLNKADTENFLSGISMIRDMSSLNGSISNSIMKAMSNMMLSMGSIKAGTVSGGTANNNTDNVFNITAEFPNAENVNEIREAILSLPNIASQYINEKKL